MCPTLKGSSFSVKEMNLNVLLGVYLCRQMPQEVLYSLGHSFLFITLRIHNPPGKRRVIQVLCALQKQICHFCVIFLTRILDMVYSPAGSLPFDKFQWSVTMENSRNSRVNEFQPPFHSVPLTFPSSLISSCLRAFALVVPFV